MPLCIGVGTICKLINQYSESARKNLTVLSAKGCLYIETLIIFNSYNFSNGQYLNMVFFYFVYLFIYFQKKTVEQKKKEQDDLNLLFKPVIGQKVSAGIQITVFNVIEKQQKSRFCLQFFFFI